MFTSFSPGFIRFVVDWMMEKPASYGLKAYLIIMKRRKGFFSFYIIDVEVESGGGELEERNEPR